MTAHAILLMARILRNSESYNGVSINLLCTLCKLLNLSGAKASVSLSLTEVMLIIWAELGVSPTL